MQLVIRTGNAIRMAKDRHVDLENIGTVRIIKNPRSKNMRITLRASEGLCLSIPSRLSYSQASRFLYEKRAWLEKWVQKHKAGLSVKEYENGERLTKRHMLNASAWAKNEISCMVKNNHIHIRYPETLTLKSEPVLSEIKNGIVRALRLEASEYLPQRTVTLATATGFCFENLRLKNLKSRWGSCSAKNNINLNIHLMRLDDKLIDYVIFHELCHTVEKNHSSSFWALLEKVFPGAKECDRRLSSFSPRI